MRVVVSLMIFQACDWGALDRTFGHSLSCLVLVNPYSPSENLSTQRVQHLAPFVTTALIFGTLDPTSRSEPLKVRTRSKVVDYDYDGTPTESGYRRSNPWSAR